MRRRALCAAGGGVKIPEGVSIATFEGWFVPYDKWNNQGTPKGVAVKLPDRTIILSLKTSSVKWASSTGDVAGVPTFTSTTALKNYMDGEEYTKALASYTTITNTAAHVALMEAIKIGNKVLTGHIGSTGEWAMVGDYAADVMGAYSVLGYSFVTASTNYWTSCERASGSTWICQWDTSGAISWSALSKTNARVLRTFFTYK